MECAQGAFNDAWVCGWPLFGERLLYVICGCCSVPDFLSVRGDRCVYIVSSLYVLGNPSTLIAPFSSVLPVKFRLTISSMGVSCCAYTNYGRASFMRSLLPLELQVELLNRSFIRRKLWMRRKSAGIRVWADCCCSGSWSRVLLASSIYVPSRIKNAVEAFARLHDHWRPCGFTSDRMCC